MPRDSPIILLSSLSHSFFFSGQLSSLVIEVSNHAQLGVLFCLEVVSDFSIVQWEGIGLIDSIFQSVKRLGVSSLQLAKKVNR